MSTRERLERARHRAPARRGRGRRSVGLARRAAPLARWARAQHPELRDLHQPRLARDRGLDLLQPAALPLRQPRQGHPADVQRRPGHRGQRRAERARAHRDDRHRGSRPDRRVLAHRPALLAYHALHGPYALRRERRRRLRQHPHRGRPLLPGRLRRRSERGLSTSSWAELGFNNSSVHTDIVSTTDRRSPRSCAAAASGSSTATASSASTMLRAS